MRESCMYGSERGARGNSRPYRTRERMANPKCQTRPVFDTFGARSSVLTGLKMRRITRGEFITLLGGREVTWPMMARAQQPTMPLVRAHDVASTARRISAAGWPNPAMSRTGT